AANAAIGSDGSNDPVQRIIVHAAVKDIRQRAWRGCRPIRQGSVVLYKRAAGAQQIAFEVIAFILAAGWVVTHIGYYAGTVTPLEHPGAQIEHSRLSFSINGFLAKDFSCRGSRVRIDCICAKHEYPRGPAQGIIGSSKIVPTAVPRAD